MFAKQCWCLAKFPESLVGRVLRDKYLKTRPSFRQRWGIGIRLHREVDYGDERY